MFSITRVSTTTKGCQEFHYFKHADPIIVNSRANLPAIKHVLACAVPLHANKTLPHTNVRSLCFVFGAIPRGTVTLENACYIHLSDSITHFLPFVIDLYILKCICNKMFKRSLEIKIQNQWTSWTHLITLIQNDSFIEKHNIHSFLHNIYYIKGIIRSSSTYYKYNVKFEIFNLYFMQNLYIYYYL